MAFIFILTVLSIARATLKTFTDTVLTLSWFLLGYFSTLFILCCCQTFIKDFPTDSYLAPQQVVSQTVSAAPLASIVHTVY